VANNIKGGSVVVAEPGNVHFAGRDYPAPPGASKEAEYIQEIFPNTTRLRGPDTFTKDLLQRLSNASLFHFTGHAITQNYGGQLLTQSKDGGAAISASTIRKTDLRKMYLAVLSACSTGAAEGERSRDPNGLVHAFLQSGTKYVIASSWDIDSATTVPLMELFYSALIKNGFSAVSALKVAQQIARDRHGTHPYYWASFQIFGNVM